MIGISVLAEEKKVAKKSIIMVDKMIGCFMMKRIPSRMASRLIVGVLVGFDCCGMLPIRNNAMITARNERALIKYV